DAVRPWQYVLEPLRGYLLLGQKLAESGQKFSGAWNFGPRDDNAVPVREIVRRMSLAWDRVAATFVEEITGPHEDNLVMLDISKAKMALGWQPVLTLGETIDFTVDWYRSLHEVRAPAHMLVYNQLHAYQRRLDCYEGATF